jgi:hypothetical protein
MLVAFSCKLRGVCPSCNARRMCNMGQMVVRVLRDGITPIETHLPDLPPQLAQLSGRMLARARDDRPRDLAEVRAAPLRDGPERR